MDCFDVESFERDIVGGGLFFFVVFRCLQKEKRVLEESQKGGRGKIKYPASNVFLITPFLSGSPSL